MCACMQVCVCVCVTESEINNYEQPSLRNRDESDCKEMCTPTVSISSLTSLFTLSMSFTTALLHGTCPCSLLFPVVSFLFPDPELPCVVSSLRFLPTIGPSGDPETTLASSISLETARMDSRSPSGNEFTILCIAITFWGSRVCIKCIALLLISPEILENWR